MAAPKFDAGLPTLTSISQQVHSEKIVSNGLLKKLNGETVPTIQISHEIISSPNFSVQMIQQSLSRLDHCQFTD